jgi:CRISPR system Cascade subunit CasC
MNLELHILQSFSPSNLNRDDTGSPKDCEFGGVRRARVSSQCLKGSIRLAFQRQGLLKEDSLAVRTRRLAFNVADRLVAAGREAIAARAVAERALAAVGLGAGKNGDSEYLLFVPKSAIDEFARTCLDQWDALQSKPANGGKTGKKADPEMPREVTAALERLFAAGRAADLALFGRMIADRPGDNVVAASQVAHALSTHRVDLDSIFTRRWTICSRKEKRAPA